MEGSRAAHVLVLQGLDRTALNALLHDRRPDLAAAARFPRPHPSLDALMCYTGGNAFCAIEVMDALGPNKRAARLDRLPLPDRVALMLHRRRRCWRRPCARVDAAALALAGPRSSSSRRWPTSCSAGAHRRTRTRRG
jgi:hypothetical protein